MGYITIQGQTWDMVAKEVYGNELYAGFLMESNPEHINTFIFSAGTTLKTPEVKRKVTVELPPWRR